VVALLAARLYSTGIALDIAVRYRASHQPIDQHDLFSEVQSTSYGHVGAQRLLLGVQYPNGQRTTNIAAAGHSSSAPPGPILASGSSSGGGDGVDAHYFLTPAPPPDEPLQVFCAWPHRGVPETRTLLDTTELTDALARVRALWPLEPQLPTPPSPPQPPTLPESGWFTDHALELGLTATPAISPASSSITQTATERA
jgi:hypothetical protein